MPFYILPVTIQAPSDAPILKVIPNAEFVQSGTTFTLRCITHSVGNHTYKFLKDNFMLKESTDMTYLIQSPTPADSGMYTCVVWQDGVDSLQSDSHAVTFIGEHQIRRGMVLISKTWILREKIVTNLLDQKKGS